MPLKEGSWMIPPPTKKVKWLWKISSRLAVATVGLYGKLWLELMNKAHVHNRDVLHETVAERPKWRGLLTVSNHTSCMDDPLMWGSLKVSQLLNYDLMRWTSAAEDIVFLSYWHSLFFSLGKVFPIVRGDGVYQKGTDFTVQQLDLGKWCHFFPEGKVNLTHEVMRLKWGVGRIISDCRRTPLVLPVWHVGMDTILPNKRPYIPQIRKQVTLCIGKPMDFSSEIENLRSLKKTPQEIRKYITDKIQDEFKSLRATAENIHKARSSS